MKTKAQQHIQQAELCAANNQFKEAAEHYKKAVEIFPSAENTFAAALFYDDLDRLKEAAYYYNRCLSMDLSPAQRADVLNRLGFIFSYSNDYPEAEKVYAEALGIIKQLVGEDPQTYKPNLAAVLHNLGNLFDDKEEYMLAKSYNDEALQLYKDLAAKDAKSFNPDLARSLYNMGSIYENGLSQYEEAEKYYTAALELFRKLALDNPQGYNPEVAMTLQVLGDVSANKAEPDYGKAKGCFDESLSIFRALAVEYPRSGNLSVAMTLVLMAIFYQDHLIDKRLSIQYAKEAIEILKGVSGAPAELLDNANCVLEKWTYS